MGFAVNDSILVERGLPELAYIDNSWNKSPGVAKVIAVKRGESGYHPIYTEMTVDELNVGAGVSKAQAQAMHVGSMMGWDVPGADPKNYGDDGAMLAKD